MNRIHHPFVVKIRKQPSMNTHNSVSINTVDTVDFDNNINEYINMNKRSFEQYNDLNVNVLEKFDDFKAKLEENISSIKQRLNTVENKSNIEDINYALQLIDNINSQLESYKKITDERIEKLVKLFLIINNKISSLKIEQ